MTRVHDTGAGDKMYYEPYKGKKKGKARRRRGSGEWLLQGLLKLIALLLAICLLVLGLLYALPPGLFVVEPEGVNLALTDGLPLSCVNVLLLGVDDLREGAQRSDAVMIVSGGQGAQETVTEALAMERYLIEKGISANRIIREEYSVSTRTNLNNSKKILDEIFDYDYSVALITSDYHVYRASEYAQSAGLNCNHAHADIEWYSAPMRYLRECAAIIKLWLFE